MNSIDKRHDILVSADSHWSEPGDLWTSRLPKKFRDRALRTHTHGSFVDVIFPGMANVTSSRARHFNGDVTEDSDSLAKREADMDADGIWAEVVYGNYALILYVPDHELCMAHARVYNDYVAEFFGANSKRHVPVAQIPVTQVDDAVAEIQRVAKLGLRAIHIPSMPPVPYSMSLYDPLWAAAQDCGMVISFHTGTGFEAGKSAIGEAYEAMTGAFAGNTDSPYVRGVLELHKFKTSGEQAVIALVCSGVMERYPKLHFVATEFDAHWLASAIATIDQAFRPFTGADIDCKMGLYDHSKPESDQPRMSKFYPKHWPYPLRPGEYVRRQVHVTFMNDPMALALRHITGTDALLWGNDYPHNEGTWPNSRRVLDELFMGVPAAERAAIVGGNTAKLFGLEMPAKAPAFA